MVEKKSLQVKKKKKKKKRKEEKKRGQRDGGHG